MNFTGWTQVSSSETTDYGTIQHHALGTYGMTRDGRMFRYVLNGAVALVVGNAIQGPATVANHLALTPSAAAIGATQVVATLGATLATANQYAEGWVQVDTTPGNGYAYQVSGHAAVASSGVITANLAVDEAIQVALTTSSRVGFHAHPCSGALQFPVTTATGALIGVAVSPIAIAQYGWLQFKGPCPALIAGTPALGAMVLSPGTTAGASVIMTTTNLVVAQLVGRMMQVGVDGKNNMVYLDIQ